MTALPAYCSPGTNGRGGSDTGSLLCEERSQAGADGLLPCHAGSGRQQHGDHGGVARNERQPGARCGRGRMGGQCLSPDRRDFHHCRRRRGGPDRGTTILDCRDRLVCSRVTDHRACPGRLRGGRGTCAARAGRRVRRGRHACGGDRSGARTHGERRRSAPGPDF